jgi:3-deoxy-7-phosphoheptulonate synthase
MLITVKPQSDPSDVQRHLAERGLWTQKLEDGRRVHFLVEPHSQEVSGDSLLAIPGVEAVAIQKSAHPRVDSQPRTVQVGAVAIGPGARPVMMAGPCSVESEVQLEGIADALSRLGIRFLRGGAFKPRSSPYAFQGRGVPALRWLRDAADRHGMSVVTEAMGADEVEPVAEVADLIQIGSRNMHNYALLRAVGRARKPVLLKRGMAATVEEWLLAGEYCLNHGAPGVIFCERGLRGFDPSTRNLLDFGAVALLAHVHRLPVIVDPSHGAGRRDLVPPLARAALAVGASGLMIETHLDPGRALSDGPQALPLAELADLLPLSLPREASHA